MKDLPFNTNEPFLAYYCGEPRSGKSYLSAYTIQYALENHDYNILTDLQGIKTDNERVKRVSKQDFLALWNEEMTANLSDLYGSEHDIIFREKFKEKGYLYSLIVFDEAQEFLDAEIKVWKRVFSYYGHYDLKLIFITQDIDLVHQKYKSTPDKFIWAVSSGNRAGNRDFAYKWFNNFRMRDDKFTSHLVTDFKIPKVQKVFQSYNSGSKVIKKSNLPKVLKTAIIPAIIMCVAGAILYYLIARNIQPTTEPTTQQQLTIQQQPTTQKTRLREVTEIQHNQNIEYDLISLKYTLYNNEIIDLYMKDCPDIKLPINYFLDQDFKYYRTKTTFLFLIPTIQTNLIKGLCNEKNTRTSNNTDTSMFKQ